MPPFLKPLKHLIWLAPMLVTAGLVAGGLSGSWLPLPLGLVIAGALIAGLWLWLMARAGGDFWQQRSTQVGTNALIATLSVLVILGLINFLAVRYASRLDLTENRAFTLAPQTQQLVANLKQPLKVWVFTPQLLPSDRELLESYRRQNPQFTYEAVDPQAQPTVAEQFEVKAVGDVFVELPVARRNQFVQAVNAQERLSEAKLSNAIERVLNNQPVAVYFLQGHGERPLSEGRGAITQAVKRLSDTNYRVKPLNLADVKDFPSDARIVVVAGATKALLDPEVKTLASFLDRGGNLLLLVDPNTNPGLKPLLAPWGVLLDERIVIDATGAGRLVNLGPADPIVTQYGNHPITRDFRSNNLSFYSLARPVDVDAKPSVQNTPFLFTSDRTWAESDFKARPLSFDAKVDRAGPFSLGIALTRRTAAEPQVTESRLVVIGNSTFMTDGFFEQVTNGDVFLNAIRWLSQQEQQTFAISPKEAKNRRITLTGEQATLVSLLAVGALPLLGLAAAAVLWWRRR